MHHHGWTPSSIRHCLSDDGKRLKGFAVLLTCAQTTPIICREHERVMSQGRYLNLEVIDSKMSRKKSTSDGSMD